MLERRCFQNVFCSSKSFSNIVRKHAQEPLIQNVHSFQIRHSKCFRDIVFKMFSVVPNRFKYRHNAGLRDIVFNMFSLQLQIFF